MSSVVVKIYRFFDFVFKQLGFPEVYVGPAGFRKVRQACRKNFVLFSCNMDSVVPCYDEKTKK